MKLSKNQYRAVFVAYLFIATYSFFASVPGVDIGTMHLDKLGHFIIFFGLTALLIKADLMPHIGVVLISLLYGGGIELVQDTLAHRQGSWGDFIADACGVMFYLYIHKYLSPFYQRIDRAE